MSDLSLEEVIRGLVEAALGADLQWPDDHPRGGENGESGGGNEEYDIQDVEDYSIAHLRSLCYQFVGANLTDVVFYVEACENGERMSFDPTEGTPLEYLGHDIWLSACGHGTGFWDHGLGDLGDSLHAAAKRMFGQYEGSALPYVTSDNKISFI